jgi:hypothetical protein
MKKITFAAIAVVVVRFLGLCWLGSNLAGGISRQAVAESLSRYVPMTVAMQIVERDLRVPADTLAELSKKILLGGDETTMLLLHPNFPQGLRSELIREGKSAHYLPNASMHQTITDDDAMAMVESGRGKSYVLRQTLECRGLSADTYRAVYRKWVSGVRGDELRDNRFLVASANLPADVRVDMLERLSGIPMAGFILREHNRLSGRSDNLDSDIVEYIQVVDGWKRDISFFVRCDSLNGAGSLYEFVKTSKHYDSLDALRKDAEGKRLVKVSDVGQCSMQYEIVAGE